MEEYYNRRAKEYEEIYFRNDPGRQAEINEIKGELRKLFFDRRVLEVACGTGFWTAVVSEVAERVVGVDAAIEALEIARRKGLPHTTLVKGDAYDLPAVPGSFDAGLANLWFSHVPKARLGEFLDGFHARLEPESTVFMADNVFVEGVGGELAAKPGCEDTFKKRTLADGSAHEVLKNYYSRRQLEEILAPHARRLKVTCGKCFWRVSYTALAVP